ncbi:MAG: hypothetical protein LC637_05565, partial [Xanthomonadaceae bacterium]|nr:hypothetical protein [Xanthomonadaceae bacterium]
TQEISLACEDCSRSGKLLCAVAVGEQLSLPDRSRVWIFDVPNAEVSTFRLSVTPEGFEIRGQEERSSSSVVIATGEALPAADRDALNDWMVFLRDVLRPAGGAQPLDECMVSNREVTDLKSHRLQRMGVPNDPPIIFPISVPPGVVETGFENLIEMSQIGPWFESEFEFANAVSQTYLLAWGVIGALTGVPLDTRVFVQLFFSDGSTGLLVFEFGSDATMSWEVEPDSLQDSDGNPIPRRTRDIPDRFAFSGQAPGEDNLVRQIRRMERLGVEVRRTFPGGGGGSATECEVDATGAWVCSLIK